ncbi:MAG: PEP-CTERM sorting domain-containing protein [Fimbriimonadaceae bacterium]
MNTKVSLILLVLAAATASFAQPIVDGTKDASYGSAIAVQTINTGFGQADGLGGNGSELDAVYGMIQGGTLYLMMTGDLQGNNNHLDLFFDTGAAGQNVLTGGTSDTNPFTGETLSAGFNASQFLSVNGSVGGNALYVDSSSFSGGAWADTYLGTQGFTGSGTLSGGTNANGVQVGLNDGNVGIQTGSTGSALTSAQVTAALGVTTGVEFGIPLAQLGNPGGAIKVIAEINGNGDNYLSNQFLTGLTVGTGNLANPKLVNLTQYGNPYFTITPAPEPASMVGLALGAVALIRRRRKA